MQIWFYGATGTVTGSKYLYNDGAAVTLVDCAASATHIVLDLQVGPTANYRRHPLNDANRRHCHMRQSLHDTHAASATRKVLALRQT